MSIGIYKITNQINGKCYIGQSVKIERRWYNEKTRAFNPDSNEYNYPRSQAFRKYGLENFKFEIIEECLMEELNEKEQYYIKYYNSLVPNGYNLTLGGSNSAGVKLDLLKVEEITELLLTTNMTNSELGKFFGVSENAVCGINTGYYWHRSEIDYPIRKKVSKKISVKQKKITSDNKTIRDTDKNSHFYMRPNCVELCDIIYFYNMTFAANFYNTSTTSIRRWLDSYNIPHTIKEFKQWYEDQHNIIKQKLQPTPCSKTIVYSKDGLFLSIEESRADCCRKYNINSGHASACANGTRKSADGYILRNYIENYPEKIDVSTKWRDSFWS